MPVELKQEVVPTLCRSAIEAAAIEVVRRRRVGRGDSHYAVERLISDLRTTKVLLSLALGDEGNRAGEVTKSISKRWGEDLGDVIETVIHGRTAAIAGRLTCWYVTLGGSAPRSPLYRRDKSPGQDPAPLCRWTFDGPACCTGRQVAVDGHRSDPPGA